MKLTDLEPKWWAESGRHGQGLSFRCPCAHCLAHPDLAVRLGVAITPPLDGGAPFPLPNRTEAIRMGHVGDYAVPPGICWARTGDAFDTLTLSPSVDASGSGHWHGFIQSGAIVGGLP